ncbi:probable glutamate receptor isoform X1 [Maniola hyperantus]|uniref:probable glutamate receptor isoform X1 n=1 Tax=Aphantopus hyperantus TaxID=2795564 RepID=UPI001569AF83|nr:glutamate receptor ionotropic, delta-2-like [Maniola hyperantus]
MILLPQAFLPIEILLQSIVETFFDSPHCVTIVFSKESWHIPSSNSSIMYIFGNNAESLVDFMLNASEAGCSDYIVQIDDPEEFIIAFDKVVHMGNVRRSDRKVIMLPPTHIGDENITSNDLVEILSMQETSFIANVLLIVPKEKESNCEIYDLITHKFVGAVNNKDLMLLDRWNSCTTTFENNVNLFPHDMSNLQGKIVKVAGFTYKPYVLLDLDTNLVPLGRDGMEMRIVDEFCRWINCTVEMVRDDAHEWGEIYDNLTGVGVLGNVFEDKADIGITALYSWFEEYVVMDFSAPIIRTAITCIAPSPSLLASWEMPFLPFNGYMWVGIFFTFLYASVALTIANGFSTDEVFLTTFGIMITQSRPDTSFLSWRIRSVVGWMLMTGLVIDNAYGGGLASTFTVPKYEKSIDTIQDIVDRRLEWGATHDAWIFSLMLSQEPLIKQLVSLFRTYPAEDLKRKSLRKSMAFSIEKLPAGYFAIGEYITKEASLDYTIMLDKFYYEQCVVMMRKSSPYTDKLNVHIGRLHESGLMLAWETQVALRYLDYKVQLEVKLSRSKRDVENIEALGFRHVMGIFFIYGLGVTISILVFVMEIFVHRKNTKK